jgi:hypothetical protein
VTWARTWFAACEAVVSKGGAEQGVTLRAISEASAHLSPDAASGIGGQTPQK